MTNRARRHAYCMSRKVHVTGCEFVSQVVVDQSLYWMRLALISVQLEASEFDMAAPIALVFVILLLPSFSIQKHGALVTSTVEYTGSSSVLWSSVCQLWPGLIQKYTTSHSLHHAVIEHIDYASMNLPDSLQGIVRIFLEVENMSPDAVMTSNAITKIVLRRLLEKREYCVTATLNQFLIEAITGVFNHALKHADDSLYNTFKLIFIRAGHPHKESDELALRIVDRVHRATFRDMLYYFESVELGGLLKAVESFRVDLHNLIHGQELSGSAAPQVEILLPLVMNKLRILFQNRVTDCFSKHGLKQAYITFLSHTSSTFRKDQFIMDISMFMRSVHDLHLDSRSIETVLRIISSYIDEGMKCISDYTDQLRSGVLTCRAPDVFTIEQVYYINVLFYRLGWFVMPKPQPALSLRPQTILADTYTRLIDEIIAQKKAVDSFTCYLQDKPQLEHAYHVESIEFLQFLSSRANDSLIHHLIPKTNTP